jgi:hypothetical protein
VVYKNKTQTYSSFPMADILYDDGTNAGTTIFIQALSTNTLSTQGIGEFYNLNIMIFQHIMIR